MIFCIPLKPKVKANDWGLVCKNLNETILSIKNQVGSYNNKIIIACHDKPEIDVSDVDCRFVFADWDVDTIVHEKYKDKSLKIKLLGVELQKYDGEYAMLLDADDVLSRDLAQHVYSEASEHGYCVEYGYAYDKANKVLAKLPGVWDKPFHFYCGSSFIWKIRKKDVPKNMADKGWKLWNALKSHTEWKRTSEKLGKPLSDIPFPAVIYMQQTGENNHDLINVERANKVAKEIRENSIEITPELKREFNI